MEMTYEKNMGGGKSNFLYIHMKFSSMLLEGYFPSALKTSSMPSGEVVHTIQEFLPGVAKNYILDLSYNMHR